MNKKVVVSLIIVLVFGLIYVNRGLTDQKTYEDGVIELSSTDYISISSFDDSTTFDAEFTRKVGGSTTHTFEGMLLKDLIDISDAKEIIITSIDNYKVTLTKEEVMEDDNVYLVYNKDGDNLDYFKNDGEGPFMLVIKNDEVSTRWVRCVAKVEVE